MYLQTPQDQGNQPKGKRMQNDENGQDEGTEEKVPIECSQEKFNDAMLEALASLRNGDSTHDQRLDFLLWAEWQIQQEMAAEKRKQKEKG